MKKSLWAVLLISVFALTGCKKPAEEDLLDGTLETKDAIALPLTMQSCSDIANASTTDSLKEASADFGKFSFRWLGPTELKILRLTLTLKGASLAGNFTKTFSGTELEDTFGAAPLTISGAVQGVTPTLFTAGCGVRVGGITFKEPTLNGFATGTLSLFGVTTDSDGARDVLVTSFDVSLKYYAQ